MRLRGDGQSGWFRLPSSRVRFLVIPALCGALAAGCYSNRHVPRDQLDKLRQGGRSHELVLQDAMGRSTRVGPNSDVRFLRADGNWTAWLPGGEICVSPTAVNHCVDARRGGLPWRLVQGMEVRNLDGGTTAYGRLVLGIRVRVFDTLSVGLYPFNPTLTLYSDSNRQRDDVGWWSFPSTLEVRYPY
ncbi:MAG: hypothetical protein HY906_01500 [Deltaproteobacteria bacterium]|nr:hypothetical protein [Deltaproteobacteria bacterium]